MSPVPIHETPGQRVFITAFILTMAALVAFPDSPRIFGLFLLFWAFFALIRALWFLETAILPENSTDKPQRSKILPWLILNEKNRQRRQDIAIAARRSGDTALLIWFLMGAALSLWALYLRLFPIFPAGVEELLTQIGIFLNGHGSTRLHPDPAGLGFLHHFGKILWVGLMVWLGRSYACTAHYSAALLRILGVCFALALILSALSGGFNLWVFTRPPHWAGAGWGMYETLEHMGLFPTNPSTFSIRAAELGMKGMALFYGLCLWPVFALLKNLHRRRRKKICTLGAIGVLALMALADLCIPINPYVFPLWLGGWTLTSILWGFSGPSSRSADAGFKC
ncbi:MAG: hypothetical protein IT559_03390 [Alphaproteobacteria bacterium]|nr:hypothetical protein [Alphaproteobacteria bacterium]